MDDVLLPTEVEFFIQTMQVQNIKELGSLRWMEWYERLQKLNQQALVEASALKEEHVKETIISYNKIHILVHEAILVSIWKQKVFPILLKLNPQPKTTFIAYGILYHEVIAVCLLELLLYHENACECLSDYAIDLLDYVYDTATQLLVIDLKWTEDNKATMKENNQLLKQKEEIAFDLGIRCLSIIRYLSEYMDRISLSVVSRIYSQHDIPLLFIQILQERPWNKFGKVYRNGKWMQGDFEQISKPEAQVWLTLRHLLLDKNCLTNYEITEYKRNQFIKLLPLLTPTVIDQLSPLNELKYWLHQLQASNVQCTPKSALLMEVLDNIKSDILSKNDGKWKKIAKLQIGNVFSMDKDFLFKAAQIFSSAFNTDLLEQFEQMHVDNDASSESCKICGKLARQRCSRCKTVWYCSRQCQVDDWKEHKTLCHQ